MSFTTITVTGHYEDEDGAPAVGAVTFLLTASLQDSATHQIVSALPVTATLDASGAFSVPLIANDDPTTTPSGTSYVVTEYIGQGYRTYNVSIPHAAAGGTVDLASLAPSTTTVFQSYLQAGNNLSDITDQQAAQANLGLGTVQASWVDRSGNLTAARTSQQIAAANTNRKYFFFQNNGTDDLWLDFGATAVLSEPSIWFPPGSGYSWPDGNFIPTDAVNVIGPSAAQTFTAKEK